jgi:8-oxo-dGTP pyrophosphatase MutT (NUDIX family)
MPAPTPAKRPAAKRAAGTPVWERGRFGRLAGGLLDYARTAWWGIVAPRTTEKQSLVIAQAVVLRSREVTGALPGAADAATAPAQEVLLSIRSDLFGWELPGGTPEADESLESTVRREVLEETGVEIEIEAHVGDWVRTGFRPHTARVFLCRALGGRPAPSHETPRVEWLGAAPPPAGLFPWYEEPLAEALRQAASAGHETVPVRRVEAQGLSAILGAMRIDLGLRWRGLPERGEQRES